MKKLLIFAIIGLVLILSLVVMDYAVQNNIKIPIINPKQNTEPYVSYEEGGQPYGVDYKTMINLINIVGSRK